MTLPLAYSLLQFYSRSLSLHPPPQHKIQNNMTPFSKLSAIRCNTSYRQIMQTCIGRNYLHRNTCFSLQFILIIQTGFRYPILSKTTFKLPWISFLSLQFIFTSFHPVELWHNDAVTVIWSPGLFVFRDNTIIIFSLGTGDCSFFYIQFFEN